MTTLLHTDASHPLEPTYNSLLGAYPENLTSIALQFRRLYGDSLFRPTKFELYQRDLQLGMREVDSLDKLPFKSAPTGQQFPSKNFVPANKPMISNKTYKPTARTGLSLPLSIPQPTSFGYQITPAQLREQQENAQRFLLSREYSRSVPQRVSENDRGLE